MKATGIVRRIGDSGRLTVFGKQVGGIKLPGMDVFIFRLYLFAAKLISSEIS